MKYREHVIFNGFLLVSLLWALDHFGIGVRIDRWFLYFITGYIMGTTLLTPDLDTRTRARRRWLILAPFWWVFDRLVHHGTITHRPVVGTVVLVLWLGFVGTFILVIGYTLGLVDKGVLVKIPEMLKYSREFGWWFLGVVAGNIGHIIADAITKD